MKPSPTISVIIPTYNRREILARTLQTVFEQDFASDAYEVIVVVDGSTDGSTDFLRGLKPACGFQVIEQSNKGKSVALNTGVAAAAGTWILFLDDDLVCDRAMLTEHVAAHAEGRPALAFGRILVSPETPWTLEIEWSKQPLDAYYGPLQHGEPPIWPDHACAGPNCSVPRSIFLECGGYEESLRRFEDVELGLRLWKRGCRFRFCPGAITYHISNKSHGERGRGTQIEGAGLMTTCRMHPEFRVHTVLAMIQNAAGWKRLFYWAVAHLPFSVGVLLALPLRIAESFANAIPRLRRPTVHLYNSCQGLITFQSSVAESGSWKQFNRMFGRRLAALLYHRVGSLTISEAPELTISKEKFENHIRWLARKGYVGIRPSDWLAWCRDGKALPEKPVLVTFDDAYADLAENALPVLKRYGFGGAVYVVTGHIGGVNSWDRFKWGDHLRLMSAEQILYWTSQGIEFGAHTRSHPLLPSLDESAMKIEVEGSAQDMAQLLGTRAASFAYPFGEYNEMAVQCAKNSFDLAFSCDEGVNNLATDLHRLRRTGVSPNDTSAEFRARVRLGYNPISQLRARLRIRTRLKHLASSIFRRIER